MGIEAVKSSTPAPCRLLIKNALKLMMNGTEEDVIDFIDESRKQFKNYHQKRLLFLALHQMYKSIKHILRYMLL